MAGSSASPSPGLFEAPRPGVPTLDQRQTDELVIALVGPVGSGVTTTADLIADLLAAEFGYETRRVKVADLIRDNGPLVGIACEPDLAGSGRVARLQAAGSGLRAAFGDDYLALKSVEHMALERLDRGGYRDTDAGGLVSRPRRHAYIIDSLKNPAEVDLLADVYGDMFWLFGVFAPVPVRRRRLAAKGIEGPASDEICRIDEEEGVAHGQQVRRTVERADFFVRNDGDDTDGLTATVRRHLDIVFGVGVVTPTRHEAAMYTAVTAAASSACLSRQVGAAIYSTAGELIGIGANDVPRAGGGLYGHEDGAGDHRCARQADPVCHNDARKRQLYQDIALALKQEKLLARKAPMDRLEATLRDAGLRNLIEYSRSVHAEMEAIISVARGHKAGLVGATMYVTTFPCHACARHIVASGIARVYYIEPYPKSLALQLHDDAITIREDDASGRVAFLQYDGVAPKNMIRLFKVRHERKEGGRALVPDRRRAHPVCRAPMDGFDRREQIVVGQVQAREARWRDPPA